MQCSHLSPLPLSPGLTTLAHTLPNAALVLCFTANNTYQRVSGRRVNELGVKLRNLHLILKRQEFYTSECALSQKKLPPPTFRDK